MSLDECVGWLQRGLIRVYSEVWNMKGWKNKTTEKTIKTKRLRVKINGMRKNDKWYEENEMRRNHDKYKALVMERRHETLFSSVKVQASLW